MPSTAVVLITQTHPNHLALAEGVAQLGLTPLARACMHILPISISPLRAQGIAQADSWVFLSSHAVRHSFPLLQSYYQGQQLISIGPTTAATLDEYHHYPDVIAQPHTSAGVAQLEYFDKPRNIAIFSGKNSPKKLYHLLRKTHQVHQYAPYRRQTASAESFAITTAEMANITTVTSHSAHSLQQLNICIQAFGYQALYRKHLIVITDQMAELANQLGFQNVHLSNGPTASAVLTTLKTVHSELKNVAISS